MRYLIRAAHYPFFDIYKEALPADNLLSALWQFVKLKKKGYDAIEISYHKAVKINTSNWNQITMDMVSEDE